MMPPPLALALALVVATFGAAALARNAPTVAERAFQGSRSMQTLAEVTAVIPHPGRVQALASGLGVVTLASNVSAIEDLGSAVITATFSGYTPLPDDYITVSCGPRQGENDYLDAVVLGDAATQQVVQVEFTQLVFLRCDYLFEYVGTTYFPDIRHFALANITVPMREPPETPKQGHLSYPNDPSKMVVQYISSAQSPAPSVQFGTSPAALTSTAQGSSVTYHASNMCHASANQTAQQWFRSPGFVHTVPLANLSPATRYFYRFGNDAHGWSAVSNFTTAPLPGPNNTVRFIGYGDQDVAASSFATASLVRDDLLDGAADFIVHFGDLGYAMGSHWIWDKWGTLVEPAARLAPYMVSVGNHEFDYDQGSQKDPSKTAGTGDGSFQPEWWTNGATASNGECGVPIFNRFAAPAGGNSIFWYAFEYGNVFVIQISSEHNFTAGSTMFLWLESTLKSVDRTRTPWVIVTMHRPIYSTQMCETGDYVVSLHLRQALDPLFLKYRVNLALVAHTHSWERTCPITDGKCQPEGRATTHITVGSAGAGLEGCGYSPQYGNFSMSHLNAWGYLRVTAYPDRLNTQFVLDENGTVFDEHDIQPFQL
jgi:hypothetical protein